MKVALCLDGFSAVNNRLMWLFKLKEHFPNFKVSLFTVPNDVKADWGKYLEREEYLKVIRENLDWLQIIPHGYTHIGEEVRNADYRYFKEVTMTNIKEAFDRDELPFEKGFKAPHWMWSQGVVKALNEEGWWGAIDPKQPHMEVTDKFFCYSHALDHPFWTSQQDIQLYGHVYGTSNDLARCFDNFLNLPENVEWCYITDFLENKDD